MLDPVSLLATATAVFQGLKKAVELGREAEDVFGQLGKWASAVSDLKEWIKTEEEQQNQPPSIFKKLIFKKSVTAEAFDVYAAEVKIREQEAYIKWMFYYGPLQHLSQDGYHEFIHMRRAIKEKREKMVYEHIRRRKKFVRISTEWALGLTVTGLGVIILTHIVIFIVEHWPK